MEKILTMFQEQWMFILVSLLIIASMFIVHKIKPKIYRTFCIGALVATILLLIVCSVIFKADDLFLLLPIAILCCELFGYGITGVIIAILLADYTLIILINMLYDKNIINELVNSTLFIILQLTTAIVAGIFMDKHLRKVQKEKKEQADREKQIKEAEEEKLKDQIQSITNESQYVDENEPEIESEYTGENESGNVAVQPQGLEQSTDDTTNVAEKDNLDSKDDDDDLSIDLSKYGLNEDDIK